MYILDMYVAVSNIYREYNYYNNDYTTKLQLHDSTAYTSCIIVVLIMHDRHSVYVCTILQFN